MKTEKLFDGITDIREDLIERAEKHEFTKNTKRNWWLSAVAAMLVIALASGIILLPDRGTAPYVKPVEEAVQPMANSHSSYAITESVYPVMSDYPLFEDYTDDSTGHYDYESYDKAFEKWWNDYSTQIAQTEGFEDTIDPFFEKSLSVFLSGSDTENKIYSPLNVYIALSMLAEITDGNSRAQILSLLGAEDIESLRFRCRSIWNGNYRNDSSTKSILASSLWLSDALEYDESTMNIIAENYYASSFRGAMGSPEYSRALQSWLNEQTGGLLKEQASQIEFNPDTVLALATTIYFKASWHDRFNEAETEERIFHCPDTHPESSTTNDIVCDFMNMTSHREYFWGDNFGAVRLSLGNNSKMWLILPDEGYTPADLLSDSTVPGLIDSGSKYKNCKYIDVNLSLPKFDVSSQTELKKGLRTLGVTDIFDPDISDFSPMADSDERYVLSKAPHDARVMIDEEGCTAAAYTVLMVDKATGAIENSDQIDFILDRPFIFVITSDVDMPLFAGVVNKPV